MLARTAAEADAAATLDRQRRRPARPPGVTRAPARALQADTDLGDRLVTTGVGPLTPAEIGAALDAGAACAAAMHARGLIAAAALFLNGDMRCRPAAPLPG